MRAFLVGIVSRGAGCGRTNSPGIYTKVSSHADWIQKYTGKIEACRTSGFKKYSNWGKNSWGNFGWKTLFITPKPSLKNFKDLINNYKDNVNKKMLAPPKSLSIVGDYSYSNWTRCEIARALRLYESVYRKVPKDIDYVYRSLPKICQYEIRYNKTYN